MMRESSFLPCLKLRPNQHASCIHYRKQLFSEVLFAKTLFTFGTALVHRTIKGTQTSYSVATTATALQATLAARTMMTSTPAVISGRVRYFECVWFIQIPGSYDSAQNENEKHGYRNLRKAQCTEAFFHDGFPYERGSKVPLC